MTLGGKLGKRSRPHQSDVGHPPHPYGLTLWTRRLHQGYLDARTMPTIPRLGCPFFIPEDIRLFHHIIENLYNKWSVNIQTPASYQEDVQE